MPKLARYPPPQSAYVQEGSRSSAQNGISDAKIELETLPRPVTPMEWVTSESIPRFDSSKFSYPPNSTSEFICIDSGSATLRFARPIANHIPAWPSLQVSACLPLGCHFQPFADVHEEEESVSVVEPSSSSGAFRCERCMAFVNPHFSWFDEGSRAKCNMCHHSSKVPVEYIAPINGFGMRLDRHMRAELRNGSVDFPPAHGTANAGSIPVIIFLLDTTYRSYESGFLQSIVCTIRSNLEQLPLECEVGLILFDESIHFLRFEFSRNGSPSLLTVSDLGDPFIPDHSSFLLASPHLLTDQLVRILDLVESYAAKRNANAGGLEKSCSLAALSIACDLVGEKGGGSVMMFQATREEGVSSEEFFLNLYTKCSELRVCVDLFLCPGEFGSSVGSGNMRSMSSLVARLGGELFQGDRRDLEARLCKHLNREKFHDCLIRIRPSKGLVIDTIVDAMKRGTDTLSIPRLVSDSTLSVTFSVTENLELNQPAFLQLVCLYSRSDGTRLLRVHTVMISTSGKIAQVFKFADPEALALLLTKQAIALSLNRKRFSIRDHLTTCLVSILHAYRSQCAANSPSGQLILPDSLKTLPLQITGILKQIGNPLDDQSLNFWSLYTSCISKAAHNFVPRCFCVFPYDSSPPPYVPCSRSKISPSSIFLFDLYDQLLFYIGKDVEVQVVERLFDRDIACIHAESNKKMMNIVVDLEKISDPRLDSHVHALRKHRDVRLKCAFAASSAGEAKISNLLIEDRLGSEPGYVDWLCLLHRMILEKIEY